MLPRILGENLFDDFFHDDFGVFPSVTGRSPFYGERTKNLMNTDVRETESSYELDVDLPGFQKDEISVDLENGYLSISATKKLNNDTKDEHGAYIRRERYSGAMKRSFYVGDAVEPENVSAKYEDGILKLSVPKQVRKPLPRSSAIAIE